MYKSKLNLTQSKEKIYKKYMEIREYVKMMF